MIIRPPLLLSGVAAFQRREDHTCCCRVIQRDGFIEDGKQVVWSSKIEAGIAGHASSAGLAPVAIDLDVGSGAVMAGASDTGLVVLGVTVIAPLLMLGGGILGALDLV